MKIQDIMLAQDVKRWTIVRTAKEQSLAEHSFNVTMIARAIAKELKMDDTKITKYALDHDLDEILTGDIPTPAKDRLGISSVYNGDSGTICNEIESMIVGMADIIEAMHFVEENGIGRHARVVSLYLRDRYHQRCRKIKEISPEIVQAANYIRNQLAEGEYEVEK